MGCMTDHLASASASAFEDSGSNGGQRQRQRSAAAAANGGRDQRTAAADRTRVRALRWDAAGALKGIFRLAPADLRSLPMARPCSVMVSEELAVRGERRVEPSPEGPWDASQPRLRCSRGILRLAPADLRSLRMTLRRVGPPSLNGSVSRHAAPPRRGVGMLRMTGGVGQPAGSRRLRVIRCGTAPRGAYRGSA